jgi:arylsulfatase A-like enzyme
MGLRTALLRVRRRIRRLRTPVGTRRWASGPGSRASTASAPRSGAPAGGGDAPTGASRTYGSTRLTRRPAASDAPNVLLISIDDCNDWLGFLNNHPGTHTPNLDALAMISLSFDKAYCTAPMCLPARTSILFGQQPFDTEVYDHSDESRARYKSYTRVTPSLVDDLWAAGYDTFGAGKVFHDPQAARWTEFRRFPWYFPGHLRKQPDVDPATYDPDWHSPYDGKRIGRGENFYYTMIDFGPSGRTADREADGQATNWVLDRLAQEHPNPFLLGLGLYLPHEPWRVPQKYLDLHPLEEIVLPEVEPDDLAGLGPYARETVVDPFHRYEKIVESGLWERVVQAYQAAISYADDHVGRVLDSLASSSFADDTVVIVWSDHGFHLGEKMHIEKFTLWERATHIPLLLHVPGRYDSRRVVDAPVSAIDIGPTLAALCGARIHEAHEGRSLIDVVEDPGRARMRPPTMTWQAGNHSVRRDDWRYIRYRTGEIELYDHRSDPHERTNLGHDRRHAAVVAELDPLLPAPGDAGRGPEATRARLAP